MSEEIEEITRQELAGFTLWGKKLEPFSEAREIAAQAMGLKFPNIPEEEAERFNQLKVAYSGAPLDAAIVLWLCSVKPEVVDDAIASPAVARKMATEWMIKNDCFRPAVRVQKEGGKEWKANERFVEAFNTMIQILDNVANTEFEITTDNKQGASIMGGESPLL